MLFAPGPGSGRWFEGDFDSLESTSEASAVQPPSSPPARPCPSWAKLDSLGLSFPSAMNNQLVNNTAHGLGNFSERVFVSIS